MVKLERGFLNLYDTKKKKEKKKERIDPGGDVASFHNPIYHARSTKPERVLNALMNKFCCSTCTEQTNRNT